MAEDSFSTVQTWSRQGKNISRGNIGRGPYVVYTHPSAIGNVQLPRVRCIAYSSPGVRLRKPLWRLLDNAGDVTVGVYKVYAAIVMSDNMFPSNERAEKRPPK